MAIKNYLVPEYMIIAEDKSNGNIAGFVFGLHDYLNHSDKGMIVKTLGRDADAKYKGIGPVLVNKLTAAARERGCTYVIHAFMKIENSSMNVSDQFNSSLYREYALYCK
jgi:N-acetylglutamate synthase-like GNAT family acetyltransferase